MGVSKAGHDCSGLKWVEALLRGAGNGVDEMESNFARDDFDAKTFVRALYDGSLLLERGRRGGGVHGAGSTVTAKDGGATLKQRVIQTTQNVFGYGKRRKRNGGDGDSLKRAQKLHDVLDARVATKNDVLHRVDALKHRTGRRIKRDIASQYNYFIAVAKDARLVARLSHQLQVQLEDAEVILRQIQQRQRRRQELGGNGSAAGDVNSGTLGGSSDGEQTSIKTGRKKLVTVYADNVLQGVHHRARRDHPGWAAAQWWDDDSSRHVVRESGNIDFDDTGACMLAQLNVLIVQRRLEDAIEHAGRVIQYVRRSCPDDSGLQDGLRQRITYLTRLIIREVKSTHIESVGRQRELLRFAAMIERGVHVAPVILRARKRLMLRKLRTALVSSMASSGDDQIAFVALVCDAVCSIVRGAADDLQQAFSRKGWPDIVCILLAWVRTHCVETLVDVLSRGPLHVLAAAGCMSSSLDAVAVTAHDEEKKSRSAKRRQGSFSFVDFNTHRLQRVVSLSSVVLENCSTLERIGVPFSDFLRPRLLRPVANSLDTHVRNLRAFTWAVLGRKFLGVCVDESEITEGCAIAAISSAVGGMRKIFVIGEGVSGSGVGAAFASGGEHVFVQTVLGLYKFASWLAETLARLCGKPALHFASSCDVMAVSNALRHELIDSGLPFMKNNMSSLKLSRRDQAELTEAHDASALVVLRACDRLDGFASLSRGAMDAKTNAGAAAILGSEVEQSDSEIEAEEEEEDCWL